MEKVSQDLGPPLTTHSCALVISAVRESCVGISAVAASMGGSLSLHVLHRGISRGASFGHIARLNWLCPVMDTKLLSLRLLKRPVATSQ